MSIHSKDQERTDEIHSVFYFLKNWENDSSPLKNKKKKELEWKVWKTKIRAERKNGRAPIWRRRIRSISGNLFGYEEIVKLMINIEYYYILLNILLNITID